MRAPSGPSRQHMLFWDQGWLDPWFGWHLQYDTMPLAFPEGQREHQIACWKGEKKFNAEDSPYRRYLEFFNEAYKKGWLPESFWTRTWEADMESSFAAKKSAVMLHGPWTFDKTMAIDPTAKMAAFPATPPAAGQAQWMQLQSDPGIDTGSQAMFMRTGNEKKAEWELVKDLYIWWHSPEIVKLRAEAIGFMPAMKLDPPADLKGGQWKAIISQIETPGGKFENVKWERSVSGETQMGAKRKGGSPGTWDVESGNIATNWADLMTGKITVQDYLDLAQKNYERATARNDLGRRWMGGLHNLPSITVHRRLDAHGACICKTCTRKTAHDARQAEAPAHDRRLSAVGAAADHLCRLDAAAVRRRHPDALHRSAVFPGYRHRVGGLLQLSAHLHRSEHSTGVFPVPPAHTCCSSPSIT